MTWVLDNSKQQSLTLEFVVRKVCYCSLDRESNIKNHVTRGADKKPLCNILLFLEHGVETVLVTTCWTFLKLAFHFYLIDFVTHNSSQWFFL
jgi:hypothetical protein